MEAKINELNRYNRQQLIEGWDQQKLADATVSIVGSDFLAQYVAIPLVALGVGTVRLIDDVKATGEGFLDFRLDSGMYRVHGIEERLKTAKREMSLAGKYDYHIVNDNLKVAYEVLQSILIAEEHKVRRNK